MRVPQSPFDDKSILVQVMAWCRQATSPHLSQCWTRSVSPYGVAKPHLVNKENVESNADSDKDIIQHTRDILSTGKYIHLQQRWYSRWNISTVCQTCLPGKVMSCSVQVSWNGLKGYIPRKILFEDDVCKVMLLHGKLTFHWQYRWILFLSTHLQCADTSWGYCLSPNSQQATTWTNSEHVCAMWHR